MRYVCLFMTLMFVLFTYWQFNDLSQYETEFWQGWVITYALCAIISLISFWKALPRGLYLAVAVIALVVAAYWSLGIEWEKTVLYNETNPSGNESGGLLIVGLWFGILYWKHASLGCSAKKS